MAAKSTGLDRFGFALSDEQRMIAGAARDFATKRLAPGAAERDRTGRFGSEQIGQLAELGLLAARVPAEDGGGGIDAVGYLLAIEAIAEACAATAVVMASSNLTAKILADHATPAQKERWLRQYTQGRLGPASFALSEPSCGSDAAALRTTARSEGADGWVLDGSKMWITGGSHAGLHLVFARTDGPGPEGISCFIVGRDAPGLLVGKDEEKMGQRASGTVALHFDGCRVPANALVGTRGDGYRIALSALAPGRAGISGLAIGLGEAALAAGLSYAQERRAFGKTIAEFQNTRFVLADCRLELDAAWLLALRAAHLLDRGEPAVAECSMAKLFSTEAVGRVVDRVLQIHGGYGYSRDYAIERIYRDARVTRIYEGTSEVQRLLISHEMVR